MRQETSIAPPGAEARRAAGIEELLAAAREGIERLTPPEALAATRAGEIVLVDIRPVEQRQRDGAVPGAHVVSRNVLEWRLDPRGEHREPCLANAGLPVFLICDEGYQSSLASATLRRLGLDGGDVAGGVQAWLGLGLPLDPVAALVSRAA